MKKKIRVVKRNLSLGIGKEKTMKMIIVLGMQNKLHDIHQIKICK
jgi:hypothetical protein